MTKSPSDGTAKTRRRASTQRDRSRAARLPELKFPFIVPIVLFTVDDVRKLSSNCSLPDRPDYPVGMTGTPASAARRASIAVSPCNRPVAITLAAAA